MLKKQTTLSSQDWLQRGEKPAVFTADEKISYRELAIRVNARCLHLRRLDFVPGNRCALYVKPSAAAIETLLAMWSLGIIAVPVNTRLPDARVKEMLNSINCTHALCDDDFSDRAPTAFTLQELVSAGAEKALIDVHMPLSAPATIIFTSGSTGYGKACLHTIGNHVYSALGSNENIRLQSGDAWLLALPLYHVSGIAILFRCLLAGAAIAVPDANISLDENVAFLGATHLSLVAAQLDALLQETKSIENLGHLKAILLGGSAIPQALIKKAIENGLPIVTSYGSTEMSSQITTTRPGDSPEKVKTSGRLLKYRELKIAQNGEIWVRGETLFQGYLNNIGLQSAVDENGWFHTGDLGRMDSDGYLRVFGRKDNMFISGGENIFPEEIERALEQLPGVVRALVIPVDDARFGKRPVAFVHMLEGYSTHNIDRHALRHVLPGYKIPDFIFPLPQDGYHVKPDRKLLQQRAKELLQSIRST
ncbi:o-succinylbenzoate--CoA ligase [candidate division KSB1 bacterium]|nr:o-succinylbenzoate--CoA ligase [candidate division KSB1 bacterium]RQW04200.1 MAG: o-succinylbenzoate--CoA ligase [candidate division KSB1 bacterium]